MRLLRSSSADDRNVHRRMAAAMSDSTDEVTKNALLKDKDVRVRITLAMYETDPKRLALLAQDEYRDVRKIVAEHPSTPTEVILELSNDRSRAVRKEAKKRISSDQKLESSRVAALKRVERDRVDPKPELSEDRYVVGNYVYTFRNEKPVFVRLLTEEERDEKKRMDDMVVQSARRIAYFSYEHIGSEDILDKLKRLPENIRVNIAWQKQFPILSQGLIVQLSMDRSQKVRIILAGNDNTPIRIVNILTEDVKRNVRKTARRAVDRRSRLSGKYGSPEAHYIYSTELEQLESMMRGDTSKRIVVAFYPNVPIEMLIELYYDKDSIVQRIARTRLNQDIFDLKMLEEMKKIVFAEVKNGTPLAERAAMNILLNEEKRWQLDNISKPNLQDSSHEPPVERIDPYFNQYIGM